MQHSAAPPRRKSRPFWMAAVSPAEKYRPKITGRCPLALLDLCQQKAGG
jgi:hypothetical protein